MHKVKLLLSVLLIFSTNLFAVKDLVSFLSPKRQEQVMQNGYNRVNAKIAARHFILAQCRSVYKKIKSNFEFAIAEPFKDGRLSVSESDVYNLIATFAHDNGIMIDLPEIDASRLDCEDDAERVAGAKRKRELEPWHEDRDKRRLRLNSISLTKFMSEEEVQEAVESGGYSCSQLKNALRVLLSANCTLFAQKRIDKIEKHFTKKFFGESESGFALQSQVDDALTDLVIKLELSFGKITVPKIARCCLCHYDVDETQEFMHGVCCNSSMLHKHCAIDTLKATSDKCPLCKRDFHPNLEVWLNAVRRGDLKMIDYCLRSGRIDLSVTDRWGLSAFMIAVENCNTDMINRLFGIEKIDEADHEEVVEMLLRAGADVNVANNMGSTALIMAVERDNLKLVERLLRVNRIKVNKQNECGWTALMCAANRNNIDMLDTLLGVPRINVNLQQEGAAWTALSYAVYRNNLEILDRLLSVPGIDVNLRQAYANDDDDHTVLMHAVIEGYYEVIDRLLQVPGIDVNAANEGGDTALMLAVRKKNLKIVNKLLECPGIEINMRNDDGDTALKIAKDCKHKLVAGRLRRAGAIL